MDIDDLTPIWKALADPTRRQILDLLRERPHTTGELSSRFPQSRYGVMKHLNILVEAGLVVIRRQGRQRWNHLNTVPLQQIYERWLRPYEADWAASLIGLKQVVERTDDMPVTTTGDELSGFHIEQEIVIKAPPELVFAVLTGRTSDWYGWPYLRQKHGHVRLEPQVGGHLFEDWGQGDGMLLATVIMINPPDALRLMGPMGIDGPVQGDVWFRLEGDEDGPTHLRLSHHAVGLIDSALAERYEVGWQELLGRVKALVTEGS